MGGIYYESKSFHIFDYYCCIVTFCNRDRLACTLGLFVRLRKIKRTSMGKLLQCIQNKRLSVLDAVKNYRRVKNFAVSAASSARHLHKVHSLHSSSLYIRRWDMCRMHPPAFSLSSPVCLAHTRSYMSCSLCGQALSLPCTVWHGPVLLPYLPYRFSRFIEKTPRNVKPSCRESIAV